MIDPTLPLQPVPPASPATDIPVVPPAPVAEAERIESIDVLRGFAVMGILFVNIQFMAMTFQEIERLDWRTMPRMDGMARLVVSLFFEFKFITLFSFLFGAGLAIQMERLARTGRPFVRVYVRRLLVLLLMGVLHGVLLWYGDILTAYAILGFAALLLCKCRPRTLVIVATILFFTPVIGIIGFAAIDPAADWRPPSWESMGIGSSQPATQSTTTTTTTTSAPHLPVAYELPEGMRRILSFLADERRIYRTGSFGEIVLLRTLYFVFINGYAMLFLYVWRCLAMFLLGIAAVKWGFFAARAATPVRFMIAAVAFVVGLGLEILADRIAGRDAIHALAVAQNSVLNYVGSFFVALAYALVVLALCDRAAPRRILHPVGAVGRMALTNYLMHSVIGGLIFYSHGLGLFGSMGSAKLFGITCAILAAQLVLSPIWLRHFLFGPVEWLWRSASYGKAQPLRRRGV